MICASVVRIFRTYSLPSGAGLSVAPGILMNARSPVGSLLSAFSDVWNESPQSVSYTNESF